MSKKKKTEVKKTNWKTTDHRFVGFLDLLGFKEKVSRKNHDDIYNELSKISSLKKEIENASNEASEGYYSDADIYIVSFSDSIVVFSKNDNYANFEFFLFAVRYLFSKAISDKIAIKGGIAHGEISLNKSEQIYFGQAIIDAYLIEEDVNYLGVVCHNSVDSYIENSSPSNERLEILKGLIFENKTPLKCGKINHKNLDYFALTINAKNKDEKEVQLEVEKILEDYYPTVSGGARRYIDNTIDLFKSSIDTNLINLKALYPSKK